MALTHSVMIELGSEAPAFELPACNPQVDDAHGTTRSLQDCMGPRGLVVVFMCNHCPFVVHIENALVGLARTYLERGLGFVGISANDANQYPADSFENMARRARDKAYPFAYLYDESQEVARAYDAVCTPDIFVYDPACKLVYRGRFDETRPGQGVATGSDLARALDEFLAGGAVSMEQVPSMGCNIKWK